MGFFPKIKGNRVSIIVFINGPPLAIAIIDARGL
jgi:hypothetical protein